MPAVQAPRPSTAPDLVAEAQARFGALANYAVTLRSTSTVGEPVEVRYFYQKPGFVRMDFIQPHAGVTLSYSPETRRVLLWPFGFRTFPRFKLDPAHPLIQGANGHRIDRSDFGSLLVNVRELQRGGTTRIDGQDEIGSRGAIRLVVTGAPLQAVAGVHQYRLWLDVKTHLPLKVISEDEQGNVIETVLMDDLRIDVAHAEPFL